MEEMDVGWKGESSRALVRRIRQGVSKGQRAHRDVALGREYGEPGAWAGRAEGDGIGVAGEPGDTRCQGVKGHGPCSRIRQIGPGSQIKYLNAVAGDVAGRGNGIYVLGFTNYYIHDGSSKINRDGRTGAINWERVDWNPDWGESIAEFRHQSRLKNGKRGKSSFEVPSKLGQRVRSKDAGEDNVLREIQAGTSTRSGKCTRNLVAIITSCTWRHQFSLVKIHKPDGSLLVDNRVAENVAGMCLPYLCTAHGLSAHHSFFGLAQYRSHKRERGRRGVVVGHTVLLFYIVLVACTASTVTIGIRVVM
ncbi:hypothetical protein K438DRAFT_2095635 [Mycena galopus ATCC 62051]|nr:hypothetical protein K438DRAFT_2095635 [Mycena galopus ATCC 62051]